MFNNEALLFGEPAAEALTYKTTANPFSFWPKPNSFTNGADFYPKIIPITSTGSERKLAFMSAPNNFTEQDWEANKEKITSLAVQNYDPHVFAEDHENGGTDYWGCYYFCRLSDVTFVENYTVGSGSYATTYPAGFLLQLSPDINFYGTHSYGVAYSSCVYESDKAFATFILPQSIGRAGAPSLDNQLLTPISKYSSKFKGKAQKFFLQNKSQVLPKVPIHGTNAELSLIEIVCMHEDSPYPIYAPVYGVSLQEGAFQVSFDFVVPEVQFYTIINLRDNNDSLSYFSYFRANISPSGASIYLDARCSFYFLREPDVSKCQTTVDISVGSFSKTISKTRTTSSDTSFNVTTPYPSIGYYPGFYLFDEWDYGERQAELGSRNLLPDEEYCFGEFSTPIKCADVYVSSSDTTSEEDKAFYAAIEASTDRKVTMTIKIEEVND